MKPSIPVHYGSVFEDDDWIFEPLIIGKTLMIMVEKDRCSFYTKGGLPDKKVNTEVKNSLKSLDGNYLLQGTLEKNTEKLYLTDILHKEGQSLRCQALEDRKNLLKNLSLEDPVYITPTILKSGEEAQKQFEELGFEGVIAKQRKAFYIEGVNKYWLKIEPQKQTSFIPESPPPPILTPSASKRYPNQKKWADGLITTNMNKVLWPEEGWVKGDLIEYYHRISPYILKYLKDRPLSLNRHPHGINEKGFYQKDLDGFVPSFIEREKVYSESSEKTIFYGLCQNQESLLYFANMGCIEMNPWISRKGRLDNPDFCVIDLDPDGNAFEQVIEVAQSVHEILSAIDCFHLCKTSGATGIHIIIPTWNGTATYDETRDFAFQVVERVQKQHAFTSIDRIPAKRRKKIYLDYLQNRRSQTLASVYSLRPRQRATISTPLLWEELKSGISPYDFNIETLFSRLEQMGDLWEPVLSECVNISECLNKLQDLPS